MNKGITLNQGENVLSTLNGLFEVFDGIQNIYFGDLFLTNKRLYVVSNKLTNMEESLWFEKETEMEYIEDHSLIVGEHRVTVRWTHNGNLLKFMKAFQQLDLNA